MNNEQEILTAILTPTGLDATPYSATSLNDATRFEPEGVYTVARTFGRTGALGLEDHLNRLAESAHLVGIQDLPGQIELRAALRSLIEQAGYAETRFRITIPRMQPDHIYFALEPLNPVPEKVRAHGVVVQTFAAHRVNPIAKATSWMSERATLVSQMRPNTYEGMLTSPDGEILEGFGSNFYAIQAGTLRTAKTGILNGISRKIVLRIAPSILPVALTPVTLDDLSGLEETFLTSSSRGVIPIVQVDDHVIGSGKPGALTLRIAAAYNAWADAHIEQI